MHEGECAFAKVKRVEIQLRRGGTRGALISTRRARFGNLTKRRKMWFLKEKNLKIPVSNGDFFLDIFVGVVSWVKEICLPREKFLCFNFGWD